MEINATVERMTSLMLNNKINMAQKLCVGVHILYLPYFWQVSCRNLSLMPKVSVANIRLEIFSATAICQRENGNVHT